MERMAEDVRVGPGHWESIHLTRFLHSEYSRRAPRAPALLHGFVVRRCIPERGHVGDVQTLQEMGEFPGSLGLRLDPVGDDADRPWCGPESAMGQQFGDESAAGTNIDG